MKTTAIIFVPKIFIYHVKLLCTYENWAYDIPSQTSRLWNFLKYLRITNEKIKIHSSLSLDKSSAFPIFIIKQKSCYVFFVFNIWLKRNDHILGVCTRHFSYLTNILWLVLKGALHWLSSSFVQIACFTICQHWTKAKFNLQLKWQHLLWTSDNFFCLLKNQSLEEIILVSGGTISKRPI